MKSGIFVFLTIVKAGLIIYFVARIMMNLVKKGDPTSKRKALIQFLSMFGFLIGLAILEFGIAYILPAGD
tara:strand:- start:56063 stop:56272 length:210 start_codon:yes stop_codon:yes gene_type:complete